MKALLLLLMCLPALAADDDAKWAGNLKMNGYALSDYAGFAENWKLVTTRYRKDTGEFRFTYANPAAWKALQEGASEYPDGAVFAKTAYLLADDPNFPASLVPTKVSRYQLMVRDKNRHASTGGWGYALFDGGTRTLPGEPEKVAHACAACHAIVASLGGVFSRPLPSARAELAQGPGAFTPAFETVALAKLPSALRTHLPKGTKAVRLLAGELRKSVFQGTLDEIRPFLAREAIAGGMPAVLLSADESRFSAVQARPGKDCGKGHAMRSILTAAAKPGAGAPAYSSGGAGKPLGDSLLAHDFCAD